MTTGSEPVSIEVVEIAAGDDGNAEAAKNPGEMVRKRRARIFFAGDARGLRRRIGSRGRSCRHRARELRRPRRLDPRPELVDAADGFLIEIDDLIGVLP